MPKRAAPIRLTAVTSPNAIYKDAHEAIAANTKLIAEMILSGRRHRASLTQLQHSTVDSPPVRNGVNHAS